MGIPAWFGPAIGACFGVVLLRPETARAITDFPGYTPTTHDLFSTWGTIGDPVVRNNASTFVGADFDFSGIVYGMISEVSSRALLSPIHVASATHTTALHANVYVAPVTGGTPIKLSSGTATQLTGNGVFLGGTGWDASVGAMTGAHIAPDAGVTTYALLDLASPSTLDEQTVMEIGHGNSDPALSPRIAYTTVASVGSTTIYTRRPQAPLQGGDSGGPTMYAWTNPLGTQELTFLATHSTSDQSGDPNALNGSNLFANTTTINAANASMINQGFALRLAGVAATTWTGNSSSSYATAGNWSNGTPVLANYVAFNGASVSQRSVNFGAAARDMRGIQFGAGSAAQGFTFSSGTLQLGRGGIANYSSATQTFDSTLGVTLTDHQYWDAINANLQVSGAVNLNGKLLVVQGSHDTTIGGVVSDSAGTSIGLTKYGLGDLVLNQAATYAGKTWIYGGTLRLEGNGSLPANSTLILSNNNTSRLEMGGKQLTFASLTSFPGQANQFATIDLGAGGRITLDQTNNVDAALSAAITGGTNGASSLVLRGPSGSNIEYTLSGNSSYAGQTRIERGAFYLGHVNALGAGGAGNETIIATDEVNAPSIRITGSGTMSESLIFHQSGTTNSGSTSTTVTLTSPMLNLTGPITLARAVTVSGRSSSLQFQTSNAPGIVVNAKFSTITGSLESGAVAGSSTLTLNLFNDSTFDMDGAISNGTLSTLAVTLRGEGTITLNAVNSYTGATSAQGKSTIVNVNALSNQNGAFGKATSNVNVGNLAYSFVAGLYAGNGVEIGRNLAVSSDNTGGVRLGALDNATALYSGTVALNRAETSLYAGTNSQVTFNNNITNSASTPKIVKQGDGLVILSGNNTYAGGTTVEAGRLRAKSANALGTTGAVSISGGTLEIASGVTLANTGLQINGGTLEVNGVANGLDFQSGRLAGSGTVNAAVALNAAGKTLSPGQDGSAPGALTITGAQTWSGFTYDWQVNNLAQAANPATSADSVVVNGALVLDGSYELQLLSLTPTNQPGSAAGYDGGSRTWTVLTATSITGFNAAQWALDSSAFQFTGGTGNFSLFQDGNSLKLAMAVTPPSVPEPSTAALAGLGVGYSLLRRRRRLSALR